jgi:acyl-CoA thioesterase
MSVVVAGLDHDLALEPAADGRCVATIRRSWFFDRGPNGGFVAAMLLHAAMRMAEIVQPPCSLAVQLLRPAREGNVVLSAEVLRAGRLLTGVSVRMEQDGRPVAAALVTFAVALGADGAYDDTVFPDAPAPGDLPPVPTRIPGLPPFVANFDLRFALGHPILTEAPEAMAGIWIRCAVPRSPDTVAVTAFADAWAPLPWIRRASPIPIATVDLTVLFRDHGWYARARDDDFVLAVSRSRLLRHGLFEEDGELWSPDGVLLAQTRQLGLLL